MQEQSLYYIAVVPPENEANQVKSIKEELKCRYGIQHALKSPAHITLQMPFRRSSTDENLMINTLKAFAAKRLSFNVSLNGFNHFSNRVIFISVEDHQPLITLHNVLKNTLIASLSFTEKETSGPFHPHVTIAHRDLTPEVFNAIWTTYKAKDFAITFRIDSLCLLKHNGKNWDIFKSFPFKSDIKSYF
ncbi:2'-5' RNA ligase [Zhouia amylolytica]|uniref:2'-5' RNA ligase n=1 Tax=Zhouia amylolytica TaxID=376730 RepID=A0A1I6V097_9FLAO|nr:2'-5' RNA ligase family protein [Zhouia amylolytica]MCQ0110111.1 2'-5' RNA ligase family protein [Zhouia amylolytica]SFT07141.1 2'-5' RNA ligase [Zhouia amylolytica]